MAFLKVKATSVAEEGSGNHIATSGIYDLVLKHCQIAPTKNGATQANYIFDKSMSYGNTLIDTQGNPIFGYKIIEALAAILGGEDGELSDPEATEVKFKKSTKELMCIPECEGVDVKVWLQFGYKKWNGEIQEKVAVKRFYRQNDGASGSEAIDGDKVNGTQLAKDEAYAAEIKYEDGLTAEDIVTWKKEQADAAKGTSSASTGDTAPKGAAGAFPKKNA